jgi:hypothetical protein
MTAVYIPTMQRMHFLKKSMPKWLHSVPQKDREINLVVAESEATVTRAFLKQEGWTSDVRVIALPLDIQGIGAIREYIVEDAWDSGHATIIMSDDDVFPQKSAELSHMEAIAKDSQVLGVGCVTSYHSLLLGDRADMMKHDAPIFARAGYGFRMFALNLANVISVGNFNPELDVAFEDAELMRQGVAVGLHWYLDPLVPAGSLGKRFEPGGLAAYTSSQEDREVRTNKCYTYCHRLWPKYLAEPPKKRMSWQKMLNDFIPNWREL